MTHRKKPWVHWMKKLAMLCLLAAAGPSISAESASAVANPAANPAAKSDAKPSSAPAAKPAAPSFNFDKITKNKKFNLNTIQTTQYGPAWADILQKPENFLACKGASIALCYYSGVGPVTTCESDGKGLANCTCYVMPSGAPYLVDINAILNKDVYLKTVEVCGKDGGNCLPKGSKQAPVCDSINNNTLIPGSDLISTFTPALEKQFPISPTLCATPAPYAGCMTAPCKKTGKVDPTTNLPLAQCACPLYTGPYQVGQAISTDQCVLTGNEVWSAGYSPPKQAQ